MQTVSTRVYEHAAKLLRQKYPDFEIPSTFLQGFSWIVADMLEDNKLLPKENESVEGSLRALFKNKKLLELGCRQGFNLLVAKHHGAVVAGNTSDKYLHGAEFVRLATRGKIVTCKAQDAHKHLDNFHPDYIISINLLDKSRQGADDLAKSFFETVNKIATPNTHIYVMPSTDKGSVIKHEDWLERARNGEITSLKHNPPIKRERSVLFETYRFRINK